jgi:hypothetical protein
MPLPTAHGDTAQEPDIHAGTAKCCSADDRLALVALLTAWEADGGLPGS